MAIVADLDFLVVLGCLSVGYHLHVVQLDLVVGFQVDVEFESVVVVVVAVIAVIQSLYTNLFCGA